jgi:flagellin
MRIQHNIAAMNSYRNFGINNSKMAKNLEKLSSGYAINRAGDDAAGLAVSEKMRAQITGLDAAVKNAKDGIGMIQTAEGALTEVHDMLNRMYYLAEQSSNGTYTNEVDRANLNMEVTALKDEITRIGTTADFNGKNLFGASGMLVASKITFRIGDGTNTAQELKMTFTDCKLGGTGAAISKITLSALGLNGNNAKVDTKSSATAALANIKKAIDGVSMVRGKLGSYQNRIEHTINNLGVMKENITDAESRIRDTDVAEEMMKFTKNNIMNQASQAMLAQANQMPQGVLQLLQ